MHSLLMATPPGKRGYRPLGFGSGQLTGNATKQELGDSYMAMAEGSRRLKFYLPLAGVGIAYFAVSSFAQLRTTFT